MRQLLLLGFFMIIISFGFQCTGGKAENARVLPEMPDHLKAQDHNYRRPWSLDKEN